MFTSTTVAPWLGALPLRVALVALLGSAPWSARAQDGGVDGGGVDAGVGGGALDAGPLDAGPLDAGPLDAGPLDAGPPAPPASCPPDAVGCHRADVDFVHRDALFDEVMLDSGWVPSGASVQVRFAVYLGGQTEVDLGGTALTWWPRTLDVAVPGRPGTGRLRMSYGMEVVARLRFDVEVGGARYRWEGDIPLPGDFPRDLRLEDQAGFDPFLLPPHEGVTIWDDTEPVTVFDADITRSVIPIRGIRGGFLVDAVASLEGRYRTDRIEIADAVGQIEMEGAPVVVRPDPGARELGGAKDLSILPHGTITYDGVITLYPTLYFEIAGRRFDLVLAEVPLNVVDLESPTAFDPAAVHVPLPDIRVDPTSLGFEAPLGGGDERLLTVTNDGEAELIVTAGAPSAPFSVGAPALRLGPRASGRVAVRFDPTEPGDRPGVLLLSSNDPDEPEVTVLLYGAVTGDGLADADLAGLDAGVGTGVMDGGCGCRVRAGRPGASAGWALVALLVLRRRAGRRRRLS